ncbi:ParB N-terminal domain-containing protein [Schaalia sp. 19OD2882]|uniref:ParB/RepB/Spo0J family partition protein n=1 Tax=Schaalia sp. 19OD2882 TaxID=2794089 RepID=UPI0020A7CFD8|nr:ParB N-terminal domain-containing protein [Schaalia sp. 19OD2882]
METMADAAELEVVELAPDQVQLDDNVRKDTALSDEFLASVEALGVIAPVVASRDALGQIIVHDGQRRVLAARKIGLARIPVLIAPAPGSPEARVVEQLALNEARAALTTGELADAARQLELFGMEPDTIARKVGRRPAEVRHLLRAAASREAAAVVRRLPDLTIVQAARLAELAESPACDEETLRGIEEQLTGSPEQGDHIIAKALKDVQVEERMRELEASFAERGITCVRERSEDWVAAGGSRLARYSTLVDKKTGKPLEEQEQERRPGLVVVLRDTTDGVIASYCCHRDKAAGLVDRWYFSQSAPKAAEKTDEERAAEAAERRRVIEGNRASDAAKEVRTAYAQALVRQGTSESILTTLVDFFGHAGGHAGWVLDPPAALLQDAGVLPAKVTVEAWGRLNQAQAKKTLLAAVLTTCENRMGRSFWRHVRAAGGFGHRPFRVPMECWYLRFLARQGYALADVEREYCEACEKLVAAENAKTERGGKK